MSIPPHRGTLVACPIQDVEKGFGDLKFVLFIILGLVF